ncbi:MAG: hypothetical protein ACTSPD_15915 [Promethearchaeota archaeon]
MIFFIIFLIISSTLFLSVLLIFYQKLILLDNKGLLYIAGIIYLIALFCLPFFDPLQLPGYLASIILENSVPTIFGLIAGFIAINCAIYGIHVYFSTMNYLKEKKYRDKLIIGGYLAKMRHPLYASYHIIGLSYVILMGSTTGVIILSATMVLFFKDTKRIEEHVLIPKYKESYYIYKEKVPKKMYSYDILGIILILYLVFAIGLIGILFFSYL